MPNHVCRPSILPSSDGDLYSDMLLQIVLLGVCTSPGKGGGTDQYEELSLQPMPLYTLPSDNTIMTCFASSASGRIFMGANDGHVYEIQYAATDSWRQRRCSKVGPHRTLQ